MIPKGKNYCNEDIHNYLRGEEDYIMCPFCDLQFEEYKPRKIEPCCDNK